MNRRGFLRNLAIGVAALHLRINPLVDRPPVAMMVQWFQATRISQHYSQDYLDALDAIMGGSTNKFLQAFHEPSRTTQHHRLDPP
jgi:hypothetical protein